MSNTANRILKAIWAAVILTGSESVLPGSTGGPFPALPVPEIEFLQPQCYNNEITLRIKPVGYPEASRYWEYGVFGNAWQAVGEFSSFLSNIAGNLRELYPCSVHCETCDESRISGAISGTNYQFMNEFYMLYANLDANKSTLADEMRIGIQDQHLGDLSDAERAYISSFFVPAATQAYGWIPAYMPIVSEWNTLRSEYTDEIKFPASSVTPLTSGIVIMAFRVRLQTTSEESSFSKIQLTNIKPRPPSFKTEIKNSCPNGSTGEIKICDIAGLLPANNYSLLDIYDEAGPRYDIDGTSFTIPEQFGPGIHLLKLSYNNDILGGCNHTALVTVGSMPDLEFNSTPHDASCPGASDGSAEVRIDEGSGGYRFVLDNREIIGSTGTFTGLASGNYTLQVYDLCNTAPKTWPVPISQPTPVTITSLSRIDPTCNSVPDGSITVKASGGIAGNTSFYYQLIKDGNLYITQTGNQEWSCSGLAGGNYTVYASAGGCSPAVSAGHSLAYVQPVSFSAVPTAVDCFGSNTGSIQVTASGGNNSYLYSRDGIPETTSIFASLYSGTYLVMVKSTASVCNDFMQGYVTVGTAPKLSISFTEQNNPSCFEQDDGRITASVSGGTGAYLYSWEQYSNGAWYPESGSSNVLPDLYAGTYRLNIRDSKNCGLSKETYITDPPELIIQSAVPSDAACFGGNGSISISASGGSGGNVYSCFEDFGPVYSNSVSAISVPAGDYNIRVQDKYGCLADYPEMLLVTGPDSPLELSWDSPLFNGFNISCHGLTSGMITVEASGGNGFANDGSEYDGYMYSISGSPFQADKSFSGLPAGSYNINVRDARGCLVQKPVVLTEPAPLSLNLVSSSPVRCFGAATGEIVVSAAGGIENTYKYHLDGAETLSPGIFKDLYADTYEIKVSDLNGCIQNMFATVQSLNPPIDIIALAKDVRCFGEGNGEINTTVSGGAGGFIYGWEMKSGGEWLPLGGTTGSATNLVPGSYRVKVTDTEECFQYKDIEINEPSLLQVTGVSASDIVCFGEKGTIGIEASGGNAGIIYYCSAATGDIFESNQPELPLPAGSYSASVKDANGCIAGHPSSLVITEPVSPLDFTAAVSSYHGFSVSCNGKSDGQITVEATGGNSAGYSGYTYSLMNDPFRAINTFNGLEAGSYSVKVADARGCTLQKNFILTQPEQVIMNLQSVSPVKCYGAATGEIEVVTTGGVEDYSYKLNGTLTASSGLFEGLPAGSYIIETCDLNGCTFTLTADVEHKNPPIATMLTPVTVRCYGESDGEVTADISGGSGGFTYSWEKKNDAVWQEYQSEGTHLENLQAGVYRIRSVDSDNCSDTGIVEVKEPEPLAISKVGIKDAICFGDQGSFEIEATGGNEGYMFQYSPNNNRIIYHDYSPPDPLPEGVYALRVSDAKGCTYEDPAVYNITSPPAALSFVTALSEYSGFNISCHGNNDGHITVLASGGNGSDYYGYSYQLQGRTTQAENIFNDLEAGEYDLTVTDGRGCRLTDKVSLKQPASEIALKASAFKRPVCAYDTDGEVTLMATGGSLPYTYSVNNSQYTASAEFTGLPVNKYSFRVRDRNGCTQTLDTALVNLISEMRLAGEVADVKCFGESTGSVNVYVTGGADPFKYSWKGSASTASTALNLLNGSYTVLVTDSAGCIAEKMFTVNQPEKPLKLSASSSPACVGLKDGLIDALTSGGTPPYMFAADSDRDFPFPSSFNVYSGNHKVFVKDRNDCIAETQILVNVRNTMPDINFMLATSRYELDTLVVIDVSVPPPDRVRWEFSADAVVIDSGKNKAYVRYNHAGLFPVKMTGLFGTCAYTIEKLLNIAPFDPTVTGSDKDKAGIKTVKISPNPNDGTFELQVELYTKQQLTVAVYDLYSRLVFHEKLPADILFVQDISLPGTVMPGTYILRVTAENDSRSTVFVISE